VLFRGVTDYGLPFQAMAFLVGLAATSFYGWFALYLPELFATAVRATGQGLSYNAGRVIAAECPEAFTQVVTDFLDRHEAFVSRAQTVIHP